MEEAKNVRYTPGSEPEDGVRLPLPYKYVDGHVYADRTHGVVYTGKTAGIPLPAEQQSELNKFCDEKSIGAAVEILDAAPVGAVYVYSCTHNEDWESDTHVFLKISDKKWLVEL